MTDIISFEYESKQVRTVIGKNGEPWWIAKEVCDVLDLTNPTEAIRSLDDDEKNTLRISECINRGNPNVNIINEPGLYTLIIRSNKPEAKRFKRWITHEVLPSIRKTGGYSGDSAKGSSAIELERQALRKERLFIQEQRNFQKLAQKEADRILAGRGSIDDLAQAPRLQKLVGEMMERRKHERPAPDTDPLLYHLDILFRDCLRLSPEEFKRVYRVEGLQLPRNHGGNIVGVKLIASSSDLFRAFETIAKNYSGRNPYRSARHLSARIRAVAETLEESGWEYVLREKIVRGDMKRSFTRYLDEAGGS